MVLLAFSFALGCSVRTAGNATAQAAANASGSPLPATASRSPAAAPKRSVSDCLSIDVSPKKILKAQTFPVDFEPFRGGCFVTSHNPEYQGSPMESEYAIYQDGKKAFDFPQQFNQTGFGCWVDAVSFQDLNADALTDVIVVGKCSGKEKTYNENMVYVNNGSEFTTDLEANYKLNDFTKAKDIANFAKNNQKLFFP
jgi:hypothetical protein